MSGLPGMHGSAIPRFPKATPCVNNKLRNAYRAPRDETARHYLHLLSVCLDPSPSRIYDLDARLDTLNGPTGATLGGFKPVYGEQRLA